MKQVFEVILSARDQIIQSGDLERPDDEEEYFAPLAAVVKIDLEGV